MLLSIPGKAGRPFRTATQPVQPMQPPQMPMPTAPLLNRPGAAGGGVYGQAGSRPVPSFSPFAGSKGGTMGGTLGNRPQISLNGPAMGGYGMYAQPRAPNIRTPGWEGGLGVAIQSPRRLPRMGG